MSDKKHSARGAILTDLVLEVFRLNGRLLAAGDRLVADVGLTSARWQVLGAIHYADGPQTVSWLARSMGLTRQAVQRIVNELEVERLVVFMANPAHRRAHLVALTRKGQAAYAEAGRRQTPWVNALAQKMGMADLATTLDLLRAIRTRLEAESE